MHTHGKKFRASATKVDHAVNYQPRQALELVKGTAFAKFDETVDIAVRLGVDPKHSDQLVRGTVVLPAGTGTTLRVLVIADGDKAKEAEAAGADFVGTEYLAKIKEGWTEFDVMVATPDKMGQIGPLGRVLGPRGPHAESEGRAPSLSTSAAPCASRRGARSSSGSTRPASCMPPSARCRSRSRRSNRTSRRSWTRSCASSRAPRRASTSGRSRSRARWAPGSALMRTSTGNER